MSFIINIIKERILRDFMSKRKLEIAVSSVFFIIMGLFILANPVVFLNYRIYMAVFTTLPILIILSTSMVFVIANGEIDLSFPSIVGVSAWVFASLVNAGVNPFLAMIIGVIAGSFCGFLNSLLITNLGLSSMVLTLGMNFLLRGFIMIVTNGKGIPLAFLRNTKIFSIFAGKIGIFPVQMLWAIGFVTMMWFLFYRHKFGGHLCYIGDNLMSAREMGININRVKTSIFLLMGAVSGFVGVLLCLINNQFWPTTGDGYLLIVLAATFLGGTPTWGGVGTIYGAIMGSLILSFLETGIVSSGLTGFYTKFFFGLILILALISHKFSRFNKKGK